MKYTDMVKEAVSSGKGEQAMWRSVEYFSEYLEELRDTDPKKYWEVMRGTSESINGNHYTEPLAKLDVEDMHSCDESDKEHKGEYWSCDDVVEAMADKRFSKETTKWDIYVACNALWHDLRNVLDDEKILECAYAFFFKDEDWQGDGKIWTYMKSKW